MRTTFIAVFSPQRPWWELRRSLLMTLLTPMWSSPTWSSALHLLSTMPWRFELLSHDNWDHVISFLRRELALNRAQEWLLWTTLQRTLARWSTSWRSPSTGPGRPSSLASWSRSFLELLPSKLPTLKSPRVWMFLCFCGWRIKKDNWCFDTFYWKDLLKMCATAHDTYKHYKSRVESVQNLTCSRVGFNEF